MFSEKDIENHWNQLCIRHWESIFNEVAESDKTTYEAYDLYCLDIPYEVAESDIPFNWTKTEWINYSENQKVKLRPHIIKLLEELKEMNEK